MQEIMAAATLGWGRKSTRVTCKLPSCFKQTLLGFRGIYVLQGNGWCLWAKLRARQQTEAAQFRPAEPTVPKLSDGRAALRKAVRIPQIRLSIFRLSYS